MLVCMPSIFIQMPLAECGYADFAHTLAYAVYPLFLEDKKKCIFPFFPPHICRTFRSFAGFFRRTFAFPTNFWPHILGDFEPFLTVFLSYPTIFPISFLDQFSDHSPAFWVILGLNGPLAPHTHSPQCVSANFKKNCASCAVLHQWFSKLEGPMHSKSNEELNWELLAHSSESPPHQCCDPGRGPTSGGTWGMAGDLGAAKCVFYVDFCLK